MITCLSVALMTLSFNACSNDDDILKTIENDHALSLTRGGGASPVTYIERSWDGTKVVETPKVISDYTLLSGSDKHKDEELASGKWYVVTSNLERCLIIAPKGEAANLIVCDGANLTVSCIFIDKDCSLNIYGQEHDTGIIIGKSATDILSSTGGPGGVEAREEADYPGIGSPKEMGTLVIYGGTVTGGLHGKDDTNESVAGIGGGRNTSGGTVTIYGGKVRAYGGFYAAGIGSGGLGMGCSGDGGTLTVYGGDVEAHGGKYGAGIGGGQNGSGATVNIYGGSVRAYSGMDAAGIGSGEETYFGYNTNGGTLNVYGGYVYADGTGWGAGIGGGEDSDGAKVNIQGGKVEAWAGADAGKKNGCAIGSEDGDGHRGSLKFGDGMTVFAGKNPQSIEREYPGGERVPACYFRPYARIQSKK